MPLRIPPSPWVGGGVSPATPVAGARVILRPRIVRLTLCLTLTLTLCLTLTLALTLTLTSRPVGA